jgi:hypothetical protein
MAQLADSRTEPVGRRASCARTAVGASTCAPWPIGVAIDSARAAGRKRRCPDTLVHASNYPRCVCSRLRRSAPQLPTTLRHRAW